MTADRNVDQLLADHGIGHPVGRVRVEDDAEQIGPGLDDTTEIVSDVVTDDREAGSPESGADMP